MGRVSIVDTCSVSVEVVLYFHYGSAWTREHVRLKIDCTNIKDTLLITILDLNIKYFTININIKIVFLVKNNCLPSYTAKHKTQITVFLITNYCLRILV